MHFARLKQSTLRHLDWPASFSQAMCQLCVESKVGSVAHKGTTTSRREVAGLTKRFPDLFVIISRLFGLLRAEVTSGRSESWVSPKPNLIGMTLKMGEITAPSKEANSQSIWTLLESWSATLASWQQYILGAAARSRTLSGREMETAYIYFLRDHLLLENLPVGIEPVIPLEPRPAEPFDKSLTLTAIDEVNGVNALPTNAALTFGPQLTLIYGRNGAGKSGFARLLANACFCRQRPDILGNIYGEDTVVPSAKFHLQLGHLPVPPIAFEIGIQEPMLRRFAVFDTAVARALLSQPTSFEFKPSGFDIFPEMVRIYGEIGFRLDAEIVKRTKANTFPSGYIGGSTPALEAVSKLDSSTDLDALRTLAAFGPAETARVSELEELLVALKSKSPKKAIEALSEATVDINALRNQLVEAAKEFSSDSITERSALVGNAVDAMVTAELIGSDQFKRPFLKTVGNPEWEAFVSSAHKLARAESPDYPNEGDRCLLCEQPLSPDAKTHLQTLFEFVEGDAKKAAEQARKAVSTASERLSKLALQTFGEASRVRSHIHRLAPDVELSLVAAFKDLEAARSTAIGGLESLAIKEEPLDPAPWLGALSKLQQRIIQDVERLSADDTDASITAMEDEARQLAHRHILSQQIGEVEEFVVDARWLEAAGTAKLSLAQRPLTDREKDFFKKVVGDDYRVKFGQECTVLGCDIPIDMQTLGRDGATVRSMALKGGHKPTAILSEGEQRAVAIADFLTEADANPAVAGIILDDPVNSQDHDRMKQIAARLVGEAKRRQVIVFTHDLPFLNAMFVAADCNDIEVEAHWIASDGSGHPGQVLLGDAPVTMKAYDSTGRAEAALSKAQALTGSEQVDQIRLGMGALRRTIEEVVVKRVFKDIVPRWSDQVRVTALRKVNWDNGQVEKLCNLYEELSRYIEGHSHTDESMGSPPQTTDLQSRIEEVKALLKWAKAERARAVS